MHDNRGAAAALAERIRRVNETEEECGIIDIGLPDGLYKRVTAIPTGHPVGRSVINTLNRLMCEAGLTVVEASIIGNRLTCSYIQPDDPGDVFAWVDTVSSLAEQALREHRV